jgi:glycosyltransferase involved in cell wall biosynthesis
MPNRHDVILGFPRKFDMQGWIDSADEHPDVLPYGFDRIREYGYGIEPIELPDRPDARSLFIPPRPSGRKRPEFLVTWDEVSAAKAARISPQFAAVGSGVIWATDPVRDGKRALLRSLARRQLQRLEVLWCLSRPQTEQVSRWLGRSSPPVHYLPFGIDTDFYFEAENPAERLVVSAGNDRDRDTSTLFAALEEVLSVDPSTRAVVQTTSALPPPPGVETISNVSHGELAELFRRATCVAVATRPNWHVSGITVALEAMASGRPVVITDTPGMDDYVLRGVTGFLSAPQDAGSMAEGILALLRDDNLAREMGAAARAHVVKSHSTLVMMDELTQILDSSL